MFKELYTRGIYPNSLHVETIQLAYSIGLHF